MSWRCRRGWHQWSIYTEPIHVRSCFRCGFVDDSAKAEWVEILVKHYKGTRIDDRQD